MSLLDTLKAGLEAKGINPDTIDPDYKIIECSCGFKTEGFKCNPLECVDLYDPWEVGLAEEGYVICPKCGEEVKI